MITKLKIATANFLERTVDMLAKSISRVSATGETARSINSVLKDTDEGISARVYARGFFKLLEKGRGPTKKKPSPEMIENLTEYAKARGMDDPKKAAWAMAVKLNKEGDKTHQQGGRELYSQQLEEEVDAYSEEVTKIASDFIVDEVKKAFK